MNSSGRGSMAREAKAWMENSLKLLKGGGLSDPNVVFSNGDSLLHALVKYWRNNDRQVRYLKKLLEHGADPNLRDENQQTALMLACRSAQHLVVETLANHSSTTLEQQDQEGNTALIHAVYSGDGRTVEMILTASRRYPRLLLIQNSMGQTPESVATSLQHPDLAEAIAETRKRTQLFQGYGNKSIPKPKGGVVRREAEVDRRHSSAAAENFANSVRTVQHVNLARKRFLSLIGVFHKKP